MISKILNSLKRIIYHPVYSRIAYDFLTALFVISVSYLLFSQSSLEILFIILFPCIFISINFLSGVYSTFRLAASHIKTLTLCASSFFSFIILIFLGGNIIPILNSAIFLGLLTSIPRIFLNFSNSSTKDSTLTQIINANSPILVIGGGGYMGSVLVEKMIKNDMKVRVFDKFIYGQEVFADIRSDARLEIVEGDATDLYALTMALRNVKAVVHLAGIVGDPASMVDDRLTRHMNIVSTRMVKEAVKGLRIPRFIFASSCSVYGASNNILDEGSGLNPLSPYAKSKIDSEKELLQDTFDEFHPTVLRFATVFGHSRKPRFDLVANQFVAQAFNNGFITVTGKGQWRPFIHTRDVADAIIKVLEAPLPKVSRQIFNVGDDSLHLTIGELAKTVERIFGPMKKISIATRDDAQDPRNYRVSFKKIREALDFTCQVTIEDGLKEILENFKSNLYKKPYTDVQYSALETTKEIKKEFYSEVYQKSHFTELS